MWDRFPEKFPSKMCVCCKLCIDNAAKYSQAETQDKREQDLQSFKIVKNVLYKLSAKESGGGMYEQQKSKL